MAVTDDERREVARMLRELSGDSTYPDLIGVIADHDGWYPASDAADRLADLIEPSCDRDAPKKAAEEMFGKMRHSTKEEADAYEAMLKSKSVEIHPVDRDALLALADEIEYGASSDDGEYHDLPATMVAAVARKQMEYARRIREACGEVVG